MEIQSLTDLADEHIAHAGNATSGRSAHTVRGGRDHRLRQTLIALTAGSGLDDHESPGEATLHVLRGRVRLSTEFEEVDLEEGDHVSIPDERHGLLALEDTAVVLTVAKTR